MQKSKGFRTYRSSLFVLFGLVISNCFAQVTSITINTNKNRHKISEYIYGVNGSISDSSIKAIRQGGNRWTNYNWENGLSNAGADYNNASDGYLVNGIPSEFSNQPAAPIIYAHNLAMQNNQFFLTTVPAQGYVSAIGGSATKAPSKFWNTITPFKDAPFTLTPDLTDSTVYTDEFINFLTTKHGLALKGGINAYSIDNEPDMWDGSHPYAQVKPLMIGSLLQKTVQTSMAIRSVDSTALIFGPALGNWYGCLNFNGNDPNWNTKYSGRYSGQDRWFVSFYLDSIHSLSKANGKRLVDVLDIHWYPEAKGTDGNTIVNTKGGVEPITRSAINARIQNPRSLWDASYVENSGIAKTNGALNLIHRLQNSVNKFYPGTKIAITEYLFGKEDHYSGGLALVDALGIFGREDVFYASKWYASGSSIFLPFSKAAFNLFTNYDGKYSRFGDISVNTVNTQDSVISMYSSIDSENKLHLIVVNKVSTATTTTLNFDSYYKYASVYGFDSTNATISLRDSIKTITNYTSCTYSFPGYSAMHMIFEPVSLPQITSVKTDSVNNKIVYINFDKNIKNETVVVDSFSVLNGSTVIKIAGITIKGSQIQINLTDTIGKSYTNMMLSYDNNVLHDTNNLALKGISNYIISNSLKGSVPFLIQSTLLSNGNKITCEFSKQLSSITKNGFVIKTKNKTLTIDTITVLNQIATIILKDRLTKYDSLWGQFSGSNIQFKDESTLNTIPSFTITNNGPAFLLSLNTATIKNPGFSIELQFNKIISNCKNINKIKVIINDTVVPFNTTIGTISIVLSVSKKIEYGDLVKISYNDDGSIQANDGSFLEGFSRIIDNTISKPSPKVSIPGRVEAENFYYYIGSTVATLPDSKMSNGSYLQMNTKDNVAYRVYVENDGLFTIKFKYASGNSSIIISIDSSSVDTIKIPQTPSITSYMEYGFLKNIKKGSHIIAITDVANPMYFDYIDFISGSNLPKATYIGAAVQSTGLTVSVDFNGYVVKSPNPNAFVLTVNGDKIIPIKSVAINNLSLLLSFTDTIYKGQTVSLSLVDSTIKTTNGSSLAVFSRNISNASSKKGVLITSISVYSDNGESTISVDKGTLQMAASISPSDASALFPYWSVSDTSLAKIDGNGLLTAKQNGTVTVTAKSKDGTNISSTMDVEISNQIASLSKDYIKQRFDIYPNPATDYLFITLDNEIKSIDIINTLGITLLKLTNENNVAINNLTSGIYYIKVIDSKGKMFLKMFVKK